MAKSMFEKYLFEAPGEDPPDVQPDVPSEGESSPPDMTDDTGSGSDPPDMSDAGGAISADDDGPPDMGGDEGFDDGSGFDDTSSSEEGSDGNTDNNLGLDEKISAIMNMNLYQRFLSLLNTIAGQLTMLRNNSDILYTLSSDTIDTVESLKKLDENIRLYLKNSFLNENYSKNLLFFNKCLNLLKLLNDVFDKNIKKGIVSMK